MVQYSGWANRLRHRCARETLPPRGPRRSGALIARGLLQCEQGILHLVGDKLEDLSHRLQEVRNQSLDFR